MNRIGKLIDIFAFPFVIDICIATILWPYQNHPRRYNAQRECHIIYKRCNTIANIT